MADLSLANAMDAPEALFQTVWVPWQVIIYHQVGALEVDTFAGGIRRQQHLDFRVVPESFLSLHPILASHAAVDDYDGFRVS